MSLKYKNADVIFDGNSGIPASHMYFINTNYFELVTHQDADLTVMDDMRPVNQDGSVTPILWMGNVVLLQPEASRRWQSLIQGDKHEL